MKLFEIQIKKQKFDWIGLKKYQFEQPYAYIYKVDRTFTISRVIYSGGTVAQLSICSAKKKIHKVDYPWTLRPFSKLVFSKEFKNVSTAPPVSQIRPKLK